MGALGQSTPPGGWRSNICWPPDIRRPCFLGALGTPQVQFTENAMKAMPKRCAPPGWSRALPPTVQRRHPRGRRPPRRAPLDRAG